MYIHVCVSQMIRFKLINHKKNQIGIIKFKEMGRERERERRIGNIESKGKRKRKKK